MGVFSDDFAAVDFGEELCQTTPHEKANQRGDGASGAKGNGRGNPRAGKAEPPESGSAGRLRARTGVKGEAGCKVRSAYFAERVY